MENISNYIESGILELYVLGNLSLKERAEVEEMCVKYPELKNELLQIELHLEKFANTYQVSPSEKVKNSFFESIEFSDDVIAKEIVLQEDDIVKIEPVAKINNKGNINFYKYAFAASFALLILSIATIFYLYNNLSVTKQQIVQLQNSNQSFANRANYLENEVEDSKNKLAYYSNPNIKKVTLAGTAINPSANMLVMWDTQNQKVMIDMAALELPKNDAQHQYQLWALVDGKPVDLGVFDADQSVKYLKEMKNIGKAQTFAVTLEPRGGSVSPTLSQLIVAGNI